MKDRCGHHEADTRLINDLTTCGSKRIANHCCVGFYKNRVNTILPFSLAGLMALQVTSVWTSALGLARSGDREPLLDSFVRFLLRHRRISLNSKAVRPDFDRTIPHAPISGARSIDESRQNFPAKDHRKSVRTFLTVDRMSFHCENCRESGSTL